MVKLHKLHKFFGLSAGLVILILGITGFFIDHDKWNFLYSTTFKYMPDVVKKADTKLFEAYWINPQNSSHYMVGGKRGIYESFDSGKNFSQMTSIQCLSIRSDQDGVYAATSDGIYQFSNTSWKPYALSGKYISAISLSKDNIIAIIDKHELVNLQRESAHIYSTNIVKISASKLQDDIKLSRFVRDLHYGRGLFDGDISLLINDYAAIVISLLAISGFYIWWLIRKKRNAKLSRKLIKIHASSLSILAIIPLLILAITGVFLDHSGGLAKFMRSVTIPHSILPPVYDSLEHDIWSVDYDGKTYRIGNRYGIYSSSDLRVWEQEVKGLAYKMIRKDELLYVSGMGAPNRIYNGEWDILPKTPHMFRDVIIENTQVAYFAKSGKYAQHIPKFDDATLYSLMLTLHDGTFFAEWWVWVNDYAAFALLILSITGTIRWYRKKRAKSVIITSQKYAKIIRD